MRIADTVTHPQTGSSVRRYVLPLLFATLACAGDGPSGGIVGADSTFTITLRWVGTPPNAAIQQAFTSAATRIQTVITAEIPDAQIGTQAQPFDITLCNASMTGVTPLNEEVDDVIIFAKVDSIDGVGQVLGSAGPCLTRTAGGLTGLGIMRFDNADLQNIADNGRLGDVILHEMLHVMGIGTLWEVRGLLADKDSSDVRVTGALAAAACANDVGGSAVCVGSVPAENCLDLAVGQTCGAGTQNAHWKESIFRTELMTGYAGATNLMSRITVQALADLGYTVSLSAADAYTVPPAALMANTKGGAGASLRESELTLPEPARPRFSIDELGRVHKLRN